MSYLERRRTNVPNEIGEKEKVVEGRSVLDYAVCSYCGSLMDEGMVARNFAELEDGIASLRSELIELEGGIREKSTEMSELREMSERKLRALEAE